MTATEVRTFQLPPTATYRRRRFTLIPGDRAFPDSDGRVATVRIVQERAKRASDSAEVDEYGVQPDPDPSGLNARVFLVRNDTAPASEGEVRSEIYRVVVGTAASCNCRAGSAGLVCKHAAALKTLVEENLL